jgi:hypothetical protein
MVDDVRGLGKVEQAKAKNRVGDSADSRVPDVDDSDVGTRIPTPDETIPDAPVGDADTTSQP